MHNNDFWRFNFFIKVGTITAVFILPLILLSTFPLLFIPYGILIGVFSILLKTFLPVGLANSLAIIFPYLLFVATVGLCVFCLSKGHRKRLFNKY